tara:strand:- start:2701 stop:3528 length:828 start_codon:yes stop_codon:yes gene_type:complete
MTPKYCWQNIEEYIPKDKIIWEAFYGDGKSGTYLEEMGYNVIHEPVDFFKNDMGDIIVSNPPFSKSKEVMNRLLKLDKPFIILFPSSKINTQYFREWRNKNLQIIIPRARIHFDKKVDGETPEDYKSSCNFDCFYYCYKMNLPSDIVWLEEDKKPKVVVKKYKCDCGSEIRESNKEKHFETKKHKKFIEKKKKTITIKPKKKLIIKPKEETITIEPKKSCIVCGETEKKLRDYYTDNDCVNVCAVGVCGRELTVDRTKKYMKKIDEQMIKLMSKK